MKGLNRVSHREGSSLVELLVSTLLVTVLLVTALPTVTHLVADRSSDRTTCLAMTLERLIQELTDARAILSPRAVNGARRGRVLVFLDVRNRPACFYCAEGFLWLSHLEPDTGLSAVRRLGSCSAALFHDRGRTRRCLRIRVKLANTVLATTVRLVNTPWPPASLPETETPCWWSPSSQPTFHDHVQQLESHYFHGVLPLQTLVERSVFDGK